MAAGHHHAGHGHAAGLGVQEQRGELVEVAVEFVQLGTGDDQGTAFEEFGVELAAGEGGARRRDQDVRVPEGGGVGHDQVQLDGPVGQCGRQAGAALSR